MEDVDHRFLAREFVRMLFGIVSPASDNEPVPAPISMCEKAMMGYSIRMNGECQGRFECVKSLAGIALKYPRAESIRNHRTELQSLYDEVDNKADKPNELFQLGLTFADNGLTAQELEKEILTTFEYFLGLDRAFSYHGLQNSRDHDRKWQVLRAMAFKLWLKRGSNANLRQRIGDIISPDYQDRKEEERQQRITMAEVASRADPSLLDTGDTSRPSNKRKRLSMPVGGVPLLKSQKPAAVITNATSSPNETNNCSSSENCSRDNESSIVLLTSSSTPDYNDAVSPPGSGNATEGNYDARPPLSSDTMSTVVDIREVASDQIEWEKLALHLSTSEDLDKRVKSYLQLNYLAPDQTILCQMAPLEVYVADKLHNVRHCRLSVPPEVWPIKDEALSYLYVSGQQRSFSTELFQVVRSNHSIFGDLATSLPDLDTIVDLTRAVVLFGKSDSK
eukprot:scaffold1721_cov98-Cylindrotheca_fusiformis.AAC.1